ncbi:YehS family protein [Sporosarcina sp. CAU 1771]
MDNNDILIRLRYALDIKNSEMVEIFKLGNLNVSIDEVVSLLKKVDADSPVQDRKECTLSMLDAFLNGLIIFKRGPKEQKPGDTVNVATVQTIEDMPNNLLLKKVKIALSLTSEDMLTILELAGISISKGELGAVLRKVGHRNYKECGDRYARNFLKGLAIKYKE